MTKENILPALIKEHDYKKPSYAQTSLPYIAILKFPEPPKDTEDFSETVGPCPSQLFHYTGHKKP